MIPNIPILDKLDMVYPPASIEKVKEEISKCGENMNSQV